MDIIPDSSGSVRFTIQIDMFTGRSQLFYSFTQENPKSDEDMINPSGQQTGWEGNFIERSIAVGQVEHESRYVQIKDEIDETVVSSSYYQIERPKDETNEVVYFSVKGMEKQNDYQLYVHNKTVNFSIKNKPSLSLIISMTMVIISLIF